MKNKLYLALVCCAFLTMTVVFLCWPRSTYSELEKRDLARFPELTLQSLADGSFTRGVSSWFSDSEPYRDRFMTFSMLLDKWQGITIGDADEAVTFHAGTDFVDPDEMGDDDAPFEEEELAIADETEFRAIDYADARPTDSIMTPQSVAAVNAAGSSSAALDSEREGADQKAKVANRGILIIGEGPTVRAAMCFGAGENACLNYAKIANYYAEVFGAGVQIYTMLIPTAIDFYCPAKVQKATKPQHPVILNSNAACSPAVKPVDCWPDLYAHQNEDIYLRTDHHWTPLGAFYAARAFARVAGVPFRPLDEQSYSRHILHGYVGSMYGYSGDIAVKRAPEDFIWWEPTEVSYETTYISYTIDEDYHVTSESRPHKGEYFHHYKDGSGAAYCTFMGGDLKTTCVRTSTKNGRRLAILKDSFGNALPGYLFYSFEEIHVLDNRYFNKNLVRYVADNHITDILLTNTTFRAAGSVHRNYRRFLTQGGGSTEESRTYLKQAADSVAQTHPDTIAPTQSDTITPTRSDTITPYENY